MRRVLAAVGVCLAIGGVTWLILSNRHPDVDLNLTARQTAELAPAEFSRDDWPWWRGPTRDNRAPDSSIVLSWSEKENIIWKAPIPGRGHSSPILIGKRIFLTSADETQQRQFAFCLDRATGEVLRQTTIHERNFPRKHPDNSFASGTPATDGKRLFVVFPNGGAIHVTALDFDGTILWQKEAGPEGGDGSHGSGASLALWGSFVFISDESPRRGWVAALHRESGDVVWRTQRKSGMGSYGSPIIGEFYGKPLLLLAGNSRVTAYDPASGSVVWEREGLADAVGSTTAFGPSLIFASSGYPQRKLLALHSDGQVAWKKEGRNEIPYPPTLLWHADHLYAVSDQGLAACYNAMSGEERWKERLEGSYYSSPLLVGKNIVACSRDGTTTIFEASPEQFSVVATNKLNGAINASPVAAGGKLYLRTDSHLYCIGKK